jgi:predicted outer membrane lipoprotein
MLIVRLLFYFVIALIVLFLVILLGEKGAWYFAWVLGTVMIVLISAAGGALLDTQEQERKARGDQ